VTPRRKIALVALAVVATATTALLTNSHWKFYGWVRSEPFWRGLPASYYASQAGAFFSGDRTSSISAFERFCRQRLPTKVTSAFWPVNPPFHEKGIIIKHEDTDVIPVLLHMTHYPRTNVRWWATSMLCLDLPLTDDAITRLIELLDDPETKVQPEAVKALSYRREQARRVLTLRVKSAEARDADAAAADVFTKVIERIDASAAKKPP
jgi:hypothetical protein